MTVARAKKNARGREIDQCRDGGHEKAQTDIFERFLVQQTFDRRCDDDGCGDDDHAAFQRARKVFGLCVSVRMLFVGGACCNGQRHHRDVRGNHVDERFERIGQKAHGAGDPEREPLENDDDDRRGHRQPSEADQRHQCRDHCGSL